MTSIKLKFRPSTTPGKEGSIVFQLIYGRTVRRITSRYKIFAGEWNGEVGRIALPTPSSPRYAHLVSVESALQWELNRLQRMVQESVPVNLDEIAANFSSGIDAMDSVFNFIRRQIHHKEQIGKVRSSETYRSMLNSFTCFRKGVDLTFDMMDGMLMELYEAWMRKCGLTRNSTSFYMRILRTNYKLAVEKGVTPDRHPFRKVYCGIDKTVKRSLPFSEIKKISALDLSRKPSMDFARDMFMFSFCTRGMSFIDMAYLKKADLNNGCLAYRRKKTGQLMMIEWTKQMQDIIDKYKSDGTSYLLPIITREDGSERRQYQNQMRKTNRLLKDIANRAGLPMPLSMYYARHSWATIARGRDVPLAVISEGLGHDSETTTQIYLDSIKSSEVDKVNRMILEGL
ncbi:site-specific integrase [Paraprevotella xylaniphila]|uniref:site-specific integrase n=1 Tax=Paraprevotella xylaniphila TaxID=454155 RepID=UPI00266DC83E|nr:site-specific integrase [Paraprevotella xylaniphila]